MKLYSISPLLSIISALRYIQGKQHMFMKKQKCPFITLVKGSPNLLKGRQLANRQLPTA